MLYVLGQPAKLIYRATAFKQGFTDVHAIVERPDGTQLYFDLVEKNSPFGGVYETLLNTLPTDPVGDWEVMISAPSDGRKDVTRMTFIKAPATQESIDNLAQSISNLTDIIEIFLL